jgi:hypothetical protein
LTDLHAVHNQWRPDGDALADKGRVDGHRDDITWRPREGVNQVHTGSDSDQQNCETADPAEDAFLGFRRSIE